MSKPKHITVHKYFVCDITGEQCGDDLYYRDAFKFPTKKDCETCIARSEENTQNEI